MKWSDAPSNSVLGRHADPGGLRNRICYHIASKAGQWVQYPLTIGLPRYGLHPRPRWEVTNIIGTDNSGILNGDDDVGAWGHPVGVGRPAMPAALSGRGTLDQCCTWVMFHHPLNHPSGARSDLLWALVYLTQTPSPSSSGQIMVVYSHNVLYCASCGRGGQVAARIPLLHQTSPERDALIHRSIDLP